MQRIFRLYVEGERSTEGIAALLTREGIPTPMGTQRAFPAGVWHPATIAHLLRNTTYIGTLYDGKKQRVAGKSNPDNKTRWRKVPRPEWIAIEVPPLIDIETFEAARLDSRSSGSRVRATASMSICLSTDGCAAGNANASWVAPSTARVVQATTVSDRYFTTL